MNFLPLAIESLTLSESIGISGLGFGIVLAVLAVLAIFVMFLSRLINGKKSKPAEIEIKAETKETAAPTVETIADAVSQEPETKPEEADPVDEIPHIPGFVVLDGVKEQDAAVIMAITADKTGIPLERLDFKSIKRLNQYPVLENIEEQDAAAVMAITSDKTGIPLENLIFNSIKLVED